MRTWLTALMLTILAGPLAGADLYVARNGNDAWSGKLAEPNAEGTDGPLATLERARDEIRKTKRAGPLPREGYDVSQGQPALSAAIEFNDACRCAMERCTVAHTGAYAIGLGLGCHENRIAGCFLYDLGGGGVKVGDTRMKRTATYPELPTNNTVENNVIAGGGLMHFSSNGVWAGIVKGLAVRHNEVRDFPHIGIAVGWCWGYAPTSAADNAIEFNHIHHVMKLIQDGGGIYTLGQQPGTVIRGNVIHDALRGPFACGQMLLFTPIPYPLGAGTHRPYPQRTPIRTWRSSPASPPSRLSCSCRACSSSSRAATPSPSRTGSPRYGDGGPRALQLDRMPPLHDPRLALALPHGSKDQEAVSRVHDVSPRARRSPFS